MRIRQAIFVLALLGLTGTLLAQTPAAPPTRQPNGRLLLVNGTRISFTFGQVQMEGRLARLSGGVAVDIQGTTVTATEATVDMDGREIRLSGDVRIK